MHKFRPYLLWLMVLLCGAFDSPHQYAPFEILDNGLIAPPNSVYLRDNLFIEDAEIMNVHYMEFLHYLAQDSGIAVAARNYPDTLLFGIKHRNHFVKHFKGYYTNLNGVHRIDEILTHDQEVEKSQMHWYNYFSYQGTKNHPVVGITYEQAMKYCEWRSKLVTHYFNHVLKRKNLYKQFKNKHVEFKFRLPSAAEWEFAASSGAKIKSEFGYDTLFQKPEKIYEAQYLLKHRNLNISEDSLKKDIMKYANSQILNFNCKDRVKPYFEEQEAEPEFIYFNKPNALGLYNIIGNVAEMTSEKGIAKGGSYEDSLKSCAIGLNKSYSKPERWLGFRPVCEVIITKLK